jgi:hypothetical protein
MADTPKSPAAGGRPVEAASAAPGEKRSVSRPPQLEKASESGDPAVHTLLADRWTAQQNGDADGEAQADAGLAELGFE